MCYVKMGLLNTFQQLIIISTFIFVGKGHITYPLTSYQPYHAGSLPVVHQPATLWFATCTCPVPPPPPEPDRELQDVLEYTKKIGESVCNVGSTLSDIGEIALEDNPEVGAAVIKKLQAQISKSSEYFSDFTSKTAARVNAAANGGRVKRAAKEDGNDALNKVGDVLSSSSKDIADDKKKLSKKAREKIDKKHKEGLDKCRADSCKAAAKLLAATEDDDDRQ